MKNNKSRGNQFDDLFEDEGAAETYDFARLFENSMNSVGRKLNVGDKIRGEILSVGKEEIFVSTGTVDDGLVLLTEFDSLHDEAKKSALKVGEFLDLFVVRVQGGQVFLSPKPTSSNLADDLEDAFDMMLPVEGRVTEAVNGGFRVNVLGKTAFCPISQMDLRRIEDSTVYVGKQFEFMITQFDPKGRNIVVSRRKLLEQEKEASQAAFTDDRKIGDVVEGTVTRLEKFGAFIQVAPGIDGLCHTSELSWSRVEDPSEVVRVGVPVTAKILKVEQGLNGRMNISLSIKQVEQTPWQNLAVQIREGALIEGKVTRCMRFGAFVEVAPGIEGLVPLSEMSATKHVTRAEDVVQPGALVKVLIKEVRVAERKLTLSIKDADSDAHEVTAALKAHTSQSKPQLGTLGDQFKGLFKKD